MKFKRAYIKEDFSRTTEQGYEVVEIATSRSGRKYAIIHRPKTNDYLIAAGYRTDRGDWDQGYYDYRTLEDARNSLDKAMERAGDTRYTAMRESDESADYYSVITYYRDPYLSKGLAYLVLAKDEDDAIEKVKAVVTDADDYRAEKMKDKDKKFIDFMRRRGRIIGETIKEGMKDTLDKMVKEESLNEEAGEDTLAGKAVELSNLLFTFLYRYYTKENDSVITPEDKKAILKAQSAFDDIAEKAQMRDKTTVDDVEDIERVDTRKMSIIRGDDDIGVDEYDIVRK